MKEGKVKMAIRKTVTFKKIGDVNKFSNLAVFKCPCEIDIVSGRYLIDAKSVMGIFSLDLSKPVEIVIHNESADEAKVDEFLKEIDEFIVK